MSSYLKFLEQSLLIVSAVLNLVYNNCKLILIMKKKMCYKKQMGDQFPNE